MMNAEKESVSQREKILACAVEKFAECGYANTKMMELAQMADVNHALIHYYFGNKENLYEEVVQLLFNAWEQNVKAVSWEGDNPREILSDYIRTYFLFHRNYQNFYKIRKWDEMEGRNQFSRYIDKYWSDDINEKTATIEQWKQKGLVKQSTNGRLLMFSIFALMNDFYQYRDEQMQELLGTKAEGEELCAEWAEHISDMLLDGILI